MLKGESSRVKWVRLVVPTKTNFEEQPHFDYQNKVLVLEKTNQERFALEKTCVSMFWYGSSIWESVMYKMYRCTACRISDLE